MSDEFMLAVCEAKDYLNKGDLIRVNGVDHTYEEVSDWAYIYSDIDERIDARDITHVNKEPKRFGILGVSDRIIEMVLSEEGWFTVTDSEIRALVYDEVERVEAHYYNTDHPKYKSMVEGRRMI